MIFFQVLPLPFLIKNMNEEYEKLFSLQSVKNEMEIHKWLFDYVNQHTGINATRPIQLMIMYFTLAEQVRQSFMQNGTKVSQG